MNFLPVHVKAPLVVHHPLFRLTLPELWEPVLRQRDGQGVVLGIRPEHLSIGAPAPKNLPVRVERVEALGSETYLSAGWDGREAVEPVLLNARVDPDRPIALGESLWLSLAVEKIHLFDPSSGEAIVP